MFSDMRVQQSFKFIKGYVCIVSEVHKHYRKDVLCNTDKIVVSLHGER